MMRSAPKQVHDETPEVLTVFDLLAPGARSLLHGALRAWGSYATVEELGYGRVALVIRPGGAKRALRRKADPA